MFSCAAHTVCDHLVQFRAEDAIQGLLGDATRRPAWVGLGCSRGLRCHVQTSWKYTQPEPHTHTHTAAHISKSISL